MASTLIAGLIALGSANCQSEAEALAPAEKPLSVIGHSPALTQTDAEAWLDGMMPYALRRAGVPGAVVVIVKDHRVLLEKGYGLSDVAAGRGVDPRRTLFRVGSLSKLFTWTAVMQQVEQGRIDLDVDVNRYLDFRVPPRDGRPVTMRELMTHRAGFEEAVRGLATLDPDPRLDLGAALRRHVPARVYDPGTVPAYSNYGAALAGYIVQRVSGEPFERYVARHILTPLQMARSTFAQPLPPTLRVDLSRGYEDDDSSPGGFETVLWSPAGGLSTTGDDMAHFMIAQLDLGQWGKNRVLRRETALQMQTSVISSMPPLNGMNLGFYESNINGREVIGHDGDTVLFHAMVRLFRKEGVGLFVALNGAGRDSGSAAIRRGLFEGFSDRYFPASATPASVPLAVARHDAALFGGSYASSRRPFSSFLAGAFLLGQLGIERHDDGTISIAGWDGAGGAPRRFRETTPLVWTEVGGHDRIAVKVSAGSIVAFADDENAPVEIFQAVPPLAAFWFLGPLTGAALIALGVDLLCWPVAALVRRRYGVTLALSKRQIRARRIPTVFGGLTLAAAVGWLWVLTLLGPPTGIFLLDRHAFGIRVVQWLTIVAAAGGLVGALYRLDVKRRSGSPVWAIGWAVLLVMAYAALLWTAWTARLLTLNLLY